jgi:hypothetical protein
MDQTGAVTEGRARQTWYQCPVCTSTQTVSQPYDDGLRRIGNSLRCSCTSPESDRLTVAL